MVRVVDSGQGGPRFHSSWHQHTPFELGVHGWQAGTYSFWMRGDGWRASTRGGGRAGTKYFWCEGGWGWALASLPAQERTHWSLYTFITHKRLSPCQQFSAPQDAHSISLALNDSCPRAHLHSWSNETRIPLNGITVYARLRGRGRVAEVGKMTTFNLWPIPWAGGAWGAGTNMWHPYL